MNVNEFGSESESESEKKRKEERLANYMKRLKEQDEDQEPKITLNPNKWKVIKTARTVEAINKSASEGYFPLIMEVGDLSLFRSKCLFSQNLKTGEITAIASDFRSFGGFMKEEDDNVKHFRFDKPTYKYDYDLPFAAYIIPHDLKIGEIVFLEDIIEDYMDTYWNQGHATRLMHGEAEWTGKEFKILHEKPRVVYG